MPIKIDLNHYYSPVYEYTHLGLLSHGFSHFETPESLPRQICTEWYFKTFQDGVVGAFKLTSSRMWCLSIGVKCFLTHSSSVEILSNYGRTTAGFPAIPMRVSGFVTGYLNNNGVKVDKLPINLTVKDMCYYAEGLIEDLEEHIALHFAKSSQAVILDQLRSAPNYDSATVIMYLQTKDFKSASNLANRLHGSHASPHQTQKSAFEEREIYANVMDDYFLESVINSCKARKIILRK
ncbi:MAG: hypothetical protein KA255_07230 [Candidatus Obscuribacter sp.]|nr:hypothetical protein [Candidatus Obscuribacter sp.]